jgi:uncharacterized protein YuzE
VRFHYNGSADTLEIFFQSGRQTHKAHRSQEIMPNVSMGFDAKGRLYNIEMGRVSLQQPGLDKMVEEMVQHIIHQSATLSQEALLSIEKTIRLDVDGTDTPPYYQPHFHFDAPANLLRIELLHNVPADKRLPKQQVLEHTMAHFNDQGHLIGLEISAALQQFPALHTFVKQGQELQALQHFFQLPPQGKGKPRR